jgi:hypothetical protein
MIFQRGREKPPTSNKDATSMTISAGWNMAPNGYRENNDALYPPESQAGRTGRERTRENVIQNSPFFWFDLSGGPEILMDFAEMESGLC